MENLIAADKLNMIEAFAQESLKGDMHATDALLRMLDEEFVIALVTRARAGLGCHIQTQHDVWGVRHKPTDTWIQDHDKRVHLLSEHNAKNICINSEYEALHLRVEIYTQSE